MKLHWMKMQQLSGNKSEPTTTVSYSFAPLLFYLSLPFYFQAPPPTATANPPAPTAPVAVPPPPVKKPAHPSSTIAKKDAAKKTTIEINRKKQGLLEEQIQQQKLLLKKLETAENNAEKESIRSLMKQVDATIVMLKDSLRLTPSIKSTTTTAVASSSKPTTKISQQDALKQRAKTLQKQLETLRAKTSADMVN
jgi:hypothetical protein